MDQGQKLLARHKNTNVNVWPTALLHLLRLRDALRGLPNHGVPPLVSLLRHVRARAVRVDGMILDRPLQFQENELPTTTMTPVQITPPVPRATSSTGSQLPVPGIPRL